MTVRKCTNPTLPLISAVNAVEQFEWISDYTVEVHEKITYLKLSRKLYLSAVRQSLEEQLSVLPHENENSINKGNQLTFNGLKLKFTDKKV